VAGHVDAVTLTCLQTGAITGKPHVPAPHADHDEEKQNSRQDDRPTAVAADDLLRLLVSVPHPHVAHGISLSPPPA
jgi:hypothetical protein